MPDDVLGRKRLSYAGRDLSITWHDRLNSPDAVQPGRSVSQLKPADPGDLEVDSRTLAAAPVARRLTGGIAVENCVELIVDRVHALGRSTQPDPGR